MADLRQQGALTRDARQVLEGVDDYMKCVEVAVSTQIVYNDTKLFQALSGSFTAPGKQIA